MNFLHHSEVINYLIQRFRFKSYLEIGVHRPGGNFDLINCEHKTGVDPAPTAQATYQLTSDDYFNTHKDKFDIIFIDGLHHVDQVKRDFENSIKCLNEGGVILIHDTNPEREEYTCVPRNGLKGRWNGDVYRVFPYLRKMGYDYKTLDFDANGLTVVKNKKRVYDNQPVIMNYADFIEVRKEVIELCTKQEFIEWI